MRRRHARRWLGAALLGVGVVAGACSSGSDGPSGQPAEALAASVDKTTGARSARSTFIVESKGASDAAGENTRGEGVVDFVSRKASFTQEAPLGPNIGRLETVSNGTTAFQKYPPALAQALGLGDKVWAGIDVAKLSGPPGSEFRTITQGTASNPTLSVQLLRGATGEVSEVGKEKVRGEDTTHYRMSLDVAKAAAAAPGEHRAGLQGLVRTVGAQALPGEAWLDEQGRLRKILYTVDLSKLPNTPGVSPRTGTLTMTVELYEFGVFVQADVPPAEQVVDIGDRQAPPAAP